MILKETRCQGNIKMILQYQEIIPSRRQAIVSPKRYEIASRWLRHTRETIDRCVARLWMKD